MNPEHFSMLMVGLGVLLCLNLVPFWPRLVKTRPGTAILRTRAGKGRPGSGRQAFFHGALVIPKLDSWHRLDTTVRHLNWEFRAADRDGLEITGLAHFYLLIPCQESARYVAESFGLERANDTEALLHMFRPIFQAALETISVQMTFEQIKLKRELFRHALVEVIGKDLSGFSLQEVALTRVKLACH